MIACRIFFFYNSENWLKVASFEYHHINLFAHIICRDTDSLSLINILEKSAAITKLYYILCLTCMCNLLGIPNYSHRLTCIRNLLGIPYM